MEAENPRKARGKGERKGSGIPNINLSKPSSVPVFCRGAPKAGLALLLSHTHACKTHLLLCSPLVLMLPSVVSSVSALGAPSFP